MRNIKLVISYDGTCYHGWQCQPDLITVQETLIKAVERIVNHKIKLYGGARTDSGVHAMAQVANFHTVSKIETKNLLRGLNSLLPGDIRIKGVYDVEESFHSRYSARSKTYVYTILNRPFDSPFYTRYVWHIPYPLNVPSMNRAIKYIKGEHDFSAFKKKNESYSSHIRCVLRSGVKKRGDFIYVFIEATGFLRYMVRNITGTLVLIGQGRLKEDSISEILASKDRDMAGPTAPARGLFLKEIYY